MTTRLQTALVTVSYKNDFQNCVDLCNSVDRWADPRIEHVVIVPLSDLQIFLVLCSDRRRVLAIDPILNPLGIWKIPFPTRVRIPGLLDFRTKEKWYVRGVGKIGGWTLQQIVKIVSPSVINADVLIFVDSDVELVRAFTPEMLWKNDQLKLHQHMAGATNSSHTAWKRLAHDLLKIPANSDIDSFNYIGNLVPWYRSNVLKLQAHLTSVNGRPWWLTLAMNPNFSEYTLYGIFCLAGLGATDSHHIPTDTGLYNSIWTENDLISVDNILSRMLPEQVAVHIQSTIPLSIEDRRSLMRGVETRLQELSCNS